MRIILLAFFLFQTILFAENIPLEKVKLQLQWKYQFQFAGFIMAKELGYYKDVGLDVELLEYNNTNITKDLEEHKIDYAITNSILSYEDKKLRNVSLVATYFQRSPLVLITQPEIKSVLGLKNKKIMISNDNKYNSSLSTLLEYFNIDSKNVTLLQPSFELDDFIKRKVDAITVFRSNELFLLDKKNIPYNIIDPVEHGFSTNAINLFVSHKKIKNNPKQIKNFLSATKKGWEYALANIDEVAKLIHLKYQPNKSVEHLLYEGKITKELMLLNLYDIGTVNKEFVLKAYSQLIRNNKLNKNQMSDKLIYNAFKITPISTLKLTTKEKEWIKNNPSVSFTGDPNWLPYEAFDKNKNYIGIVSEYLKIIQNDSGLTFNPTPVSSWTEALKYAREGKVKIISGDSADAILNKNFRPTNSYNTNPIVIIMSIKNNYIEDLTSISNKKIAIIKDYGYTADIFKEYPDITFIEVLNIQEGLEGVSKGKYDVMLATHFLASYTIADMGLNNIKIVGKTPIVMNLTLFVSKDEPLLWSIINKSLKNVSEEQKHNILVKWVQQKYVEKTDKILIAKIIFIMLVIIFFILLWVFQMRQDITKRKKAEKELQKQHDFLQTIMNGVHNSIMVIHKDYSVPLMNDKAREMLDAKLIKDPLSPKCYEISHHQDAPCDGNMHPCPLEKVLQNKTITKEIHNHTNAAGENHIVELTATPLFDDEGEVIGIIESAHDITKLKQVQSKLKHQAEHDSLTGLPNRVLFLDRLNQSIKNAARNNKNIAVLFIDLDNFKNINDSLGHNVGDILLETIAKKLKTALRQIDTVARLGGDEFAIIIEHFKHIEIIISLVQNIMLSLKEPLHIERQQLYTTLSMGISIYPEDGIDSTTLIKNADTAMYRAKHNGRNNYQFYTEDMTEKALERIVLETQLRQSMEQNQLEVYYQLQVDSSKETISGMEALVRWNHPERGLISPDLFIPLAEDCGFIIQLDEWVMKTAISRFTQWHKQGLNPGTLALNLSVIRLEQDEFINNIEHAIENNPGLADYLSFEITESQIMKNPQKSIDTLNKLSDLGIKLSIDDFGTGYSSLSYLKKLPIDKLKIDRSFVMDIPQDEDDKEITKTIIAMAKNLNLKVIAEGVETKEQNDFLLANGCQEIQGYFYHKPSPADEVEKRLKHFLA